MKNRKGEIILNRNEVFFIAYAKFPEGLAATTMYNQLSLGVVVDVTTNIIVDTSCTLVTEMAQNRVKSYLVGRNLWTDLSVIVEDITFCHQGSACKSIIKALRDIHRKYGQFIEDNAPKINALKHQST